jgi:hypothetical protein
MLDFRYEITRRYTREWIIEEEWEYTPGFANCEKCGHRNEVWPRRSFERRWSRRYGKT